MKRILFLLSAWSVLLFASCQRRPDFNTRYTFDKCHASIDTIPAFVDKYDSITDANLDAFIDDWYEYSHAILQSYVPEDTTNEIYVTEFIAERQITTKEYKFVVLPLRVSVIYIDKKVNFLYVSDDPYLFKLCKLYYWKYAGSQAKDVFFLSQNIYDEDYQIRYITPVLSGQNNVLYLTDEIYHKIASYLGGLRIGEIHEDRSAPINQQHVDTLNQRKYFEFVYGHWGGYWYLESMPFVEFIAFFRNGALVDARNSYCSGNEYWYELKNNGYRRQSEPVSDWIE